MTEQRKRVLTVVTGGLFVLATVLGLGARVMLFPTGTQVASISSSAIADEPVVSIASAVGSEPLPADDAVLLPEFVPLEPLPGEEWRRAFYDIAVDAVESLSSETDYVKCVELFNHPLGSVLAVQQANAQNNLDEELFFWKAWRWEQDEAVLIFEGDAYEFYLNAHNGNPLVVTQSVLDLDKRMWAEQQGEELFPILEFDWGQNLYSFAQQKHLSDFEYLTDYPLKNYPNIDSIVYCNLSNLFPTAKKPQSETEYNLLYHKLGDDILDYYQPPVPEDTPQWVIEYIKIFRDLYRVDSLVNTNDTTSLFIQLHNPENHDLNPLMSFEPEFAEQKIYHWDDTEGMKCFRSHNSVYVYIPFQDTQGNLFLRKGYMGWNMWYHIDGQSLDSHFSPKG